MTDIALLARIDRLNPDLNAIVQRRDDEALAEARSLDARIARGEDPGPLAGVPVTVKVTDGRVLPDFAREDRRPLDFLYPGSSAFTNSTAATGPAAPTDSRAAAR